MIKSCKEHLSLSRIWFGCFTEFVPGNASHHREQKARVAVVVVLTVLMRDPSPEWAPGQGQAQEHQRGSPSPAMCGFPLIIEMWIIAKHRAPGELESRPCVLLYFENRELGEAGVSLEYLIPLLISFYISSQVLTRASRAKVDWLLTVNNEQFWWNYWHANVPPILSLSAQNWVHLINIHFLSLMVIMSFY